MTRLASFSLLLIGLALRALPPTGATACASEGPMLYNGIELPAEWPPKLGEFAEHPQPVPYLVTPPKLIPIDVGRQLFVDDFLIAATDLARTYHLPAYSAANPLLKPDRPWEDAEGRPYAMPFSDAMLYDPQDRLFKAWYYAARGACTCYATSKDGLHWEKPLLDVVPGTNIVLEQKRDSNTIWLDPKPARPEDRFKMALYQGGLFKLFASPDGIHWTKRSEGAKTGDRSTFFYNPFRERWVFSIRCSSKFGRSRQYWETTDFFGFSRAAFERGEVANWITADSADWKRDDLQARPQLYNLDATPYESLMLGLFSIWRGDYRAKNPPTEKARQLLAEGRPKQNSVCVGFSRDGFHWDRPDRRAFIPTSEKRGDWNWGNVQSIAPGCLVVGDQLWFYVSGRYGKAFPGAESVDTGGCAGLATLRRDGFASMDAAAKPGTLTTRPVRFRGKHLFVNFFAPQGELRVEVLGRDGKPVAPFDRAHCRPLRGDSTRQAVAWEGADDLSALAGQPVQFRFLLSAGSLYAFWVTPDPGGASYGYVCGGPDFDGPQDLPR